MIILSEKKPEIKIYANEHSWIEGDAIQQLKKTAEFEGMEKVVGMPDLHPGKGGPVGAAFLSKNKIYPFLIGTDIGCGMGLYQTTLKAGKAKRDKWAKKLGCLDDPWDGDVRAFLSDHGVTDSGFDLAHGTIGGGNHFAELQVIEKIEDKGTFKQMGLDKACLMLLVHSGSRGVGQNILRKHIAQYGAAGFYADSADALLYLRDHNEALKWAFSNRALIARRFADNLGADISFVLDACHNSVSPVDMDGAYYWLHRKGVIPSDKGPVIVPGSRGALSYLLKPAAGKHESLWSIAHGAGRKWNRNSCKGRLSSRYKAKDFLITDLGSRVICSDRTLLYEEAPQAYKHIETVIEDMRREGLVDVIATLKPLITYKAGETN